jgi:ABC-type nitrate/sulfonate/bicarbonate transport system substrate-binding protein
MRAAAKALLAAGMGMHISLLAALLADAGAADLVRVGEAPVASGGAFSIARAKGYFEKLGLRLEERRFEDSSSAISAMTTGEIDLALLPVEAGLSLQRHRQGGTAPDPARRRPQPSRLRRHRHQRGDGALR